MKISTPLFLITIHFLWASISLTAQSTVSNDDFEALWYPCIEYIDYQVPSNFHMGSMGGHYTYQELLDELDRMYALYPNLITEKANIGNFLTEGEPDNTTTPPIGGNGIKWVKISDNPNDNSEGEPQVLYVSLNHAREAITLTQLVYFMWYLLENYETDTNIKSMLDNTELYFVPVVNPDGLLYNEKTHPDGLGPWRKNRKNNGDGAFGVDLNRNYDYYINGDPNQSTWGNSGSSSDPSADNYHGTGPFSEVETQAIKWFVENHDFKFAVDHHAAGGQVYYPFAYTNPAPSPNEELYHSWETSMFSQYRFSIEQAGQYTSNGISGMSVDFYSGSVGTHSSFPSILVENPSVMYVAPEELTLACQRTIHLNVMAAKVVNNFGVITQSGETYLGNALIHEALFSIQNQGLDGNGSFTVSFEPITNNIISFDPPIEINGLNQLEIQSGSLTYNLSPSVGIGEDIMYALILDTGLYKERITVKRRYGNLNNLVFEESGENFYETFINDGWDITTEDFVSGPFSITDSPNSNYPPNSYKFLELKGNLHLENASRAQVSFWTKWELEQYAIDFVQFQVSKDGGDNWFAPCGIYTTYTPNGLATPSFEPVYGWVQEDWVQEKIDLNDFLGETIKIRFWFDANPWEEYDGFYFDDFKIETIGDAFLETTQEEVNNIALYPNPTQGILNIQTTLQAYQLEVVNTQGQQILQTERLSGNQQISLERLAVGLYFVNIISEEGKNTFKIIKR